MARAWHDWRTVNVIRTCLSMTLAGTLLVGGTAIVVAQDTATPEPLPEPLPEKVLFIGNSHTARHGGLDWLISNMVAAEDEPRPFSGSIRTESGVGLEYHYWNGAPDAIRSGDYDTVVLQGYIPGITTRTIEPFLEYARLLEAVVRESGAETVFFMTWPQDRLDWADLDDFVDAHRRLSEELGAKVAPVGIAFDVATAERPDLALISDDGVHASWAGAYLAAATVYATLFERNPEGLTYSFGITPDDAAFLQRIAWQAVTDWQAASETDCHGVGNSPRWDLSATVGPS